MTVAEANAVIDGHNRDRRALAWQIAALQRTKNMPSYQRYVDPPPLPSREKQREIFESIKGGLGALPAPKSRPNAT